MILLKKRGLAVACGLLFLMLSVPSHGSSDEALKKVTFIPQWVSHAQFTGYFMARERGIYLKHGIELNILPGGPENPASDLLVKGKADFASMWLASGMQMRDQGAGVVNIAQILQRSALMLVAKKSRGIHTPHDLEGKKVGLWGPMFRVQPRAFLKKYGLNVRIVPQSYSMNLFLRDGVDAASAMWYNEYHTLLNAGLDPDELTTFFFHEHGLNFPEDGIYVLEKTLRQDPDLCRAFVRASLEGWRYAFAHPEEALDIVMKNLKKEHIPATRIHQKWMLDRMKDLMQPEGTPIPMGRLETEDFKRVAKGLKENGLLQNIPTITSFYHTLYTP